MREILALMETASKLKELQRTGWIEHRVPGNLETTASHIFGVTLLAWWFSEKEMSKKERIIKMALVHDLLESITGDFTPKSISKSERDKIEERSLEIIVTMLPKELKEEIWSLIHEYRNSETKESRIVKACDRLDTLFQAYFYLKANRISKSAFEDFFSFAEEACKEGLAKEILTKLGNAAKG